MDRSARLLRIALLALSIFGSIGCSDTSEDTSLTRMSVSKRRLRTAGRWLVDEHDRLVLLHGVNAGGRAKMPPFIPFDFDEAEFAATADAYFRSVAALGSNAVRLTWSWEALEPVEGQRDTTYWSRYVAMVDAAHAHGVGVIVDFHQDVFASPFCGDGFPLWTLGDLPHGPPRYDCTYVTWSYPYFESDSVVNQAFQRLWDDADGIRTKLASTWQFVATSLADHPGVLGFEIINEPGIGTGDAVLFQETTLPAFYEQMGAVIEAAAGPGALFGGASAGQGGVAHHLLVPDLDHFVFAPHYYDALAFLGLEDLDAARIRTDVRTSITLPGDAAVPVVIGEYGMPNTNPAKEAYLDMMLDVYDEYRVNAIHWDAHVSTMRWNNEDFTAFHPDGTEQEWARALDRPYPRATAGTDVTFQYDREAGRFTVTVTSATAAVTEVYVPRRRFGTRPRIRAGGVRYRFLADEQLLLLAAEPGQTYTVEVRPGGGVR